MLPLIKPRALCYGDTIGIIAPSMGVNPEGISAPVRTLEDMGFHVRFSEHLFSETCGYAGSATERADDLNAMVLDPEVRMILFGGGEVCNEILPYVDFDQIRRNPKIICSYSDSTTILNAIHRKSGLVTFYGFSVRTFAYLTDYNFQAFERRLMSDSTQYQKTEWRTICPGTCEGVLVGGYLANYALLYGLEYYPDMPADDCILLIEDHEQFSTPAVVSKYFSNLEHRGVFRKVRGLIFGHYSQKEYPLIDEILARVGKTYGIPVVRCEDFGHGIHNSIFPLGVRARLDTETDKFQLLEAGVVMGE